MVLKPGDLKETDFWLKPATSQSPDFLGSEGVGSEHP